MNFFFLVNSLYVVAVQVCIAWISLKYRNNAGGVDVNFDGFGLDGIWSFKMLELSSKLDQGSYVVVITKTASKKCIALIHSKSFFSSEVMLCLYKASWVPCDHF